MRYFAFIISLFVVFSCSETNQKKQTNFNEAKAFNGQLNIEVPTHFIIDKYHFTDNQVPEKRFKSKDNTKFITIKKIPKIFNDLQVARSMMQQDAKDSGAKIIAAEVQKINEREFFVKESELVIDQVSTYKIDAITILKSQLLTVVLSCPAKEKDNWSIDAKKVLNSIIINE